MNLAKKIFRLRAGQSYAEIARAAKCSPPTIRDIESGIRKDTSVRLAAALAKHFQVPLDWLADDTEDWPPPASTEDNALSLIRQALDSAGLLGELTDRERQLLSEFRQLDAALRNRAIGLIQGMALEQQGRENEEQPRDVQDAIRRAHADAESNRRPAKGHG